MRKPLAILLILFTVIAASYMVFDRARMNMNGYCSEKKRYLSEDERIQMAMEEVLVNYPLLIIPGKDDNPSRRGRSIIDGSASKRYIFYSSLEDFFKSNPDCCKFTLQIDADSGPLRGMVRWTGAVSGFVIGSYQVRFYKKDGSMESTSVPVNIKVSSCGKINRWYNQLHSNWFDVLFFLVTRGIK